MTWYRHALRVVFPAYVLLVVFLSLTPSGPQFQSGGDKWAHYGAYFVMALLGLGIPRTRTRRAWMFVLVVSIGAVLEWLQGFSPVRFPDPWDALANAIGAATGAAVWWGVAHARRASDRSVR